MSKTYILTEPFRGHVEGTECTVIKTYGEYHIKAHKLDTGTDQFDVDVEELDERFIEK